MSLLEIKAYLTQVKIASLASLCAYFKCDSELCRNMMMHWVRKGCVRTAAKPASCGSCTKCGPEIYEWIDQSLPCRL